jgi:hypothetical protein
MSIFKKNFLPAQSQPWARQIEDRVRAFEGGINSLDVNTRSKDEQFAAALNRLNAATIKAQTSADEAAAAAATANAAAANAQTAIDGLGALDEPTSTFKINAANVTVGNLSGDRISGGEIVGTTLKTAASGPRIELNRNDMLFYDDDGNFSGRIDAENAGRAATLNIDHQGLSGMYVYNGGLELYANGVIGVNSTGFAVYGANISSGSLSTGSVGCSSVSSSGSISGTTVSSTNFSGTVNTSIAGNTTSSFAGNVFINTSGNMFRSTATSSREAKENVEEYNFDTDAFISVNPVTFNYKLDAVSDPEEAQIKQLGFILEDFEDAGAGEFLTIPTNEMDKYKGLRYDKLYMMLHKVVQEQQVTIKDLTSRIEALESR